MVDPPQAQGATLLQQRWGWVPQEMVLLGRVYPPPEKTAAAATVGWGVDPPTVFMIGSRV